MTGVHLRPAVIGSIHIMRGSEGVAKLRLLYAEPPARELGLGRRLAQECIDDARAKATER